jgi:hypothetical protein
MFTIRSADSAAPQGQQMLLLATFTSAKVAQLGIDELRARSATEARGPKLISSTRYLSREPASCTCTSRPRSEPMN